MSVLSTNPAHHYRCAGFFENKKEEAFRLPLFFDIFVVLNKYFHFSDIFFTFAPYKNIYTMNQIEEQPVLDRFPLGSAPHRNFPAK